MTDSFSIPFRITLRGALFVGGSLCFAVLFLAYVLFQARFLIQGPIITLTEELSVTQSERKIVLRGSVQNITRLILNGRQIFTNETGYFEEAMFLENGYTIVTLAATDRYGRETKVVRPFVYVPTLDTESVTNDTQALIISNETTYGNQEEENNRAE